MVSLIMVLHSLHRIADQTFATAAAADPVHRIASGIFQANFHDDGRSGSDHTLLQAPDPVILLTFFFTAVLCV